jgi:hypothetical protein
MKRKPCQHQWQYINQFDDRCRSCGTVRTWPVGGLGGYDEYHPKRSTT